MASSRFRRAWHTRARSGRSQASTRAEKSWLREVVANATRGSSRVGVPMRQEPQLLPPGKAPDGSYSIPELR
eukprot:8321902-Alexandrium_andersonii.AAC.1